MYRSLLLLLVPFYALSQSKIHNVWNFSNRCVDFNSGNPVALPSTPMYAPEASSGVCDGDGNLLFYTNGGQNPNNQSFIGGVWNRNNQLMPNGLLDHDAAGCNSAHMGTIVVPDPANSTKTNSNCYFILTVDCMESLTSPPPENKGLRYTKIDMSLDGGLGDVLEKGVPIVTMPVSGGVSSNHEIVTAMPHANGTDYWILFAQKDSVGILLLSAAGFSEPTYFHVAPGYMVPSPKGDRLMIRNLLFDFDAATGTIANPLTLTPGGTCFSPDGLLLYIINGGQLKQYNLQAPDIPASSITLGGGLYVRIHLAPDHRIYLLDDDGFTGRIECPSVVGTDCDYNPDYTLLLGEASQGVPHYMQSPFYYEGNFCDELSTGTDHELPTVVLSPNPNKGTFRLSLPVPSATIVLSAMDGTIAAKLTVDSNQDIDLRDLSPGLYFISSPERLFSPIKMRLTP